MPVTHSARRRRERRVGLLPGALMLILLLAAIRPSPAQATEAPPLLTNGRNQFTLLKPPRPAPMTPFADAQGELLDLGRFTGRTVLLNFWATWCPPCIEELPSLDRLQGQLDDAAFEIVALSIDEGDVTGPVAFVRRLGLNRLEVYHDFTGAMAARFPLYGLPITYLVGGDGRVLGYIVGAVAWDSPEAVRFVTHYAPRLEAE